MCRLALLNKQGVKYIEKIHGIANFFDYLELAMGGNGNGYAYIDNNRNIHLKKGVKLSNKEIAQDILTNINDIQYVLYHTRIASIGTVGDKNCHPFKMGNNVLAMNGTEFSIKKLIKNSITDTQAILQLLVKADIDIKEGTKKFDSVFIGYNGTKVFANRNYGSLKYLHHNKRTLIFASEFPKDYYEYEKIYTAPKSWAEGEEINTKVLSLATFKESFWTAIYPYEYYSYDESYWKADTDLKKNQK
jgi:predicted glutamine amidotransferase